MKIILFFLAATTAFAQQPFDLTTFDKLESKATSRTNITLDGQLLKLAAGLLDSADSKDSGQFKSLVGNLKGIYVRGFEFDKDGQYSAADLEPMRNSLRRAPWSRIVDVHSAGETSEIWVAQTPAGDKFAGVAIINAEPRSLTIVYISGLIGTDDIARLNGRFGINVDSLISIRPNTLRNNGKKPEDPKKKDNEQ